MLYGFIVLYIVCTLITAVAIALEFQKPLPFASTEELIEQVVKMFSHFERARTQRYPEVVWLRNMSSPILAVDLMRPPHYFLYALFTMGAVSHC